MEATMGSVLLRGGCPCDAVRFEITDVFDAGYCHCNRCRKQSGAPVFALVHVPRTAFTLLSGELVAEPWERLGQGMICASCRGGVCFDMGDRDLLSIAIGRLDEPARVRPTFHQCVSCENTITHPSSLSDLAPRAGLGRIGALIRPFFVAGWDAVGQFPHD